MENEFENEVENIGIIEIKKAEWATRLFLETHRDKTTARALHYFALGRKDYPIFQRGRNPTGKQAGAREYGEDDDYGHLTTWVAYAKRLGMIDWDALPDESVGEYGCEQVFEPEHHEFYYHYGSEMSEYDVDPVIEHLKEGYFTKNYYPVRRDQPYHLELWVEKSTMNGILEPTCSEHSAVLVTFRGKCSWGAVWKLCKRVAVDGRPAIIVYLSDLDQHGFTMAREMSRKVAEVNKNFFDGNLDVRIRRIGLTPEQVAQYDIPLVYAKPSANNLAQYQDYLGDLDSTKKAELDALERYYPGGVSGLVGEWLDKYHDKTLDHRCEERTAELVKNIKDHPLPPEILEQKSKVLRGLEVLIKNEAKTKPPAGEDINSDIKPDTQDPSSERWLLDTTRKIYPDGNEIDFVSQEEEA